MQCQPVDKGVQSLGLVGQVGVGANELLLLQNRQHRFAGITNRALRVERDAAQGGVRRLSATTAILTAISMRR